MEDLSQVNIVMERPHLHGLPELQPLPTNYSLRRLDVPDEAPLAQLLSLVFEEVWDEKRVQNELTRAAGVRACYGAFWRGKLVATTSSQQRQGYPTDAGFLHWVATHPEHRRKGLGAALVKHVLEDFQERDYQTAWLVTQPTRTAAIRSYLKFGFTPHYKVEGKDQRGYWTDIFQAIVGG